MQQMYRQLLYDNLHLGKISLPINTSNFLNLTFTKPLQKSMN